MCMGTRQTRNVDGHRREYLDAARAALGGADIPPGGWRLFSRAITRPSCWRGRSKVRGRGAGGAGPAGGG